jgi:hypothetical protein
MAREEGGPVLPGATYTVGAKGPETLVMRPDAGMVLPRGSGGHIKIIYRPSPRSTATAEEIRAYVRSILPELTRAMRPKRRFARLRRFLHLL